MTPQEKMKIAFCLLLVVLGYWAVFADQWLGGIGLMLWAAWITADNMPVDKLD